MPNVFGKWCRPNYNSVVATFCHNISHNLDIQINDESHMLNLVYIADIIHEFKSLINDYENLKTGFKEVEASCFCVSGVLIPPSIAQGCEVVLRTLEKKSDKRKSAT